MKVLVLFLFLLAQQLGGETPNVILLMTDDQGWGQTGYYDHPVLKTPHLDEMAAGGLRFDRFYAGAPVCSPTRASVLTGRANDRSGVASHGKAMRLPEKTIASALKKAGYATGHFGKWHLNGLRGPGVPVLAEDPYGPENFGFETWITVTNFFDRNPFMGSASGVHQFDGSSSEAIVGEAIDFIQRQHSKKKPFFAVIWDGSPHSPFEASQDDRAAFQHLDQKSRNHYGELVAFDRSVGRLRKTLRDLKIAQETLIWFCSDNGGLPGIEPTTTGALRGHKGSLWEGGIRVPGIVEWPAVIRPRVTSYPVSTMDIFPTIAAILGLSAHCMLSPVDGESLKPLFTQEIGPRKEPIAFHFLGKGALIDNDYKLISLDLSKRDFALYHLSKDPKESTNIAPQHPQRFENMVSQYLGWYQSIQESIDGQDYPESFRKDQVPESRFWTQDSRYQALFERWKVYPGFQKLYEETKRRAQ